MSDEKSTGLKLVALHEFLVKQDNHLINELYEHPATCMSVFRELPEIAKHVIMRILFINQPIARQLIDTWVKDEKHDLLDEAFRVLSGLRIWQSINNNVAYQLNETFRANLQKALFGGGETWTPASETHGADKHGKTLGELDVYAKERWDCLLSYLARGTGKVSQEIIQLLRHAQLCDSDAEARFQFLLLDRASQVWYLLIQYLSFVQTKHFNLVKVLSFILQLGFCSLGVDYVCDNDDSEMVQVIQHFRELGLVFKRKGTSKRFYPTRLALSISICGGKTTTSTSQDEFIIVETNYRIYAYTDSDLHYSIISLFSDVMYRFPQMIVAQMTRDSVMRSAEYGITAKQMLHYLNASCHPSCKKNLHPIPQVVSDNVHLWCEERNRMKFNEGTLYNQFLTQDDFEILRDYAKEMGVLIWENEEKRFMVVTTDSHDDIKRYYKSLRDNR